MARDADDLHARLLGLLVRDYRARADLSVRSAAHRQPFDYSTLSKVETGSLFPGESVVTSIDHALDASGRIVDAWTLLSHARGRSLEGNSHPAHTRDDNVERRAAIHLLAALAAGAAFPADLVETLRAALGRSLRMAADHSLDDWEQTAYEYASFLRVLPPGQLLGNLAADVADLHEAINRTADDGVRAGLHRVCAQMSAIMAMVLNEMGDFPAASRWWRTARQAADISGNIDLRVWIRGRQALVTQTNGMTSLALRLAQEAARLGDSHPSAGLAEAQAARVKVLTSRDPMAARRALEELGGLYERLPSEVTGEHSAIWGYPEDRLLSCRTGVLTALGDAAVYDDLIGEVSRFGSGPSRASTRANLKMGWFLINRGEIDQGVTTATQAVADLPTEHHTTAVMRLAGRVCSALPDRARALPAYRELRAIIGGQTETRPIP